MYTGAISTGNNALDVDAILAKAKHEHLKVITPKEQIADYNNKAAEVLPTGIYHKTEEIPKPPALVKLEKEKTKTEKSKEEMKEDTGWNIKIGADIQVAELPETRMIVEDLISEGTTLISDKPKTGKSYLLLNLCLNVAEGKPFWGKKVEQCDTLYLALEDKGRDNRIKKRLNEILGGKLAPRGFYYVNEKVDNLDNGFLEQLGRVLDKLPNVGVVVVDTLSCIRGKALPREKDYAYDAREIESLTDFANARHIALILVHHTNKKEDGDIIDKSSGTTALTGKVDNPFLMYRDSKDKDIAYLEISGRDIDEDILVLSRNYENHTWDCLGSEDDIAESRAREKYNSLPLVHTIRQLVAEAPEGIWTGGAQKLIDEGVRITGRYICDSSRAVGTAIRAIRTMLYDVDSIVFTPIKNGSGGQLYRFIKQQPVVEDICSNYNIPF